MKISQEPPTFKPITIVLESSEEAEDLWQAIIVILNTATIKNKKLFITLSNYFSEVAKL